MEPLANVLTRIKANRQEGYAAAEAIDLCPKCQGSGWITFRRPLGHPQFGEAYECDCRLSTLSDSLDTFLIDPRYPDLERAKNAVEDWLSGDGPPMLALAGEPGRGKTHLALTSRDVLRHAREPVCYMTDRELDAFLRNSFTHSTTTDALHYLDRQPWLILDDFGLVARSDTLTALIEDIINLRWAGAANGHRTMITTNIVPTELSRRIASRLLDVTRARAVVIEAADFRQTQRASR